MLSFIKYVSFFIVSCHGLVEYFFTGNTTIDPSFGAVLRFDMDSNQDAWVIPSATLDYWFTFQGIQAEVGTPQRYGTLQWRADNHYLAGYGWHTQSTDCDTAYVEIYEASEMGVISGHPLVGPVCGTEVPGVATTTTGVLVLHLYVEAPPPGTYNSSIVADDDRYRALPSCVNDSSVNTSSANSSSVNGTSSSNVTSENSTICTTEYGPFINFTVDFTSYFIGNCSQDNIDDEDQFECNPGTERCIASSLQCDIYYSNNCGDNGDVRASPPGNCSYDVTTTTQHTEEATSDGQSGLLVDLLPLWIILGLLAALMMSYWCCWRPGWLPWRLARLRNVRCCQTLSKCCQNSCCVCCKKHSCCQSCVRGGACGGGLCCLTCGGCKSCTQTGSGYPHSHAQYNLQQENKVKNGNGDGKNPTPTIAPNWVKFANDDGAHIREMR